MTTKELEKKTTFKLHIIVQAPTTAMYTQM